MFVVTGDETGLCKVVSLRGGASSAVVGGAASAARACGVASVWGSQTRARPIASLCWLGDGGSSSTVASLAPCGTVEVWDPRAGALLSRTVNAQSLIYAG